MEVHEREVFVWLIPECDASVWHSCDDERYEPSQRAWSCRKPESARNVTNKTFTASTL